jgi:casein kinase II subunit alpha
VRLEKAAPSTQKPYRESGGMSAPPDPFRISNACIGDRFNPDHPNISRVHTNVNLDLGPDHWQFRNWNPQFGDILRYKLTKWIGSGRYSDVFLAIRDNTDLCAIKLLKPVNTDRVRRELKILTQVQGQESILKLIDIVIDGKVGIPAMVTEAVEGNQPWRELFASISLDDARFYIYRILQALDHTHRKGVMRRDVKPVNILCLDPKRRVRLADWGLAEFYHPMRKYSVHVATRYYKSPEILMDYEYYDYSMDIWSVGVMLLEILSQKLHVFDGGDNDHQIDAVIDVVGGRPMIAWADKYRVKLAPQLKEKMLATKGIQFESLIPYARRKFRDREALDLVSKSLTIDHKDRISAEQALQHPFFKLVRITDAAAHAAP